MMTMLGGAFYPEERCIIVATTRGEIIIVGAAAAAATKTRGGALEEKVRRQRRRRFEYKEHRRDAGTREIDGRRIVGASSALGSPNAKSATASAFVWKGANVKAASCPSVSACLSVS